MGAVTAIMYGDRDPTIAGMVLDSPFSSLKMLVEELVKEKVNLPNFILNQALSLVKSTVQKKAKFKLEDIEPIIYAKQCFIPSLFVAAKDDLFVKPHHSKILHDSYPGDKNLISIEGDHNSSRPRFFKDSAAIFFYNTLQVQFIKEISDNYAGFIYDLNLNPIEDKNKENEGKNNILELSSNNSNINIPNNISNNIFKDPGSKFNENNDEKCLEVISDKFNYIDLGDDEEELFKKILEMSKIEFENQNQKVNQGSIEKLDNSGNVEKSPDK
jgi:hypothetical protein